jgi:hypothetical protein
VLKPGARLAVLDFNNSDNPLIDGFQAWALENVVVPQARSYGLGPEYEYLRPSIKAFPTGMYVLVCGTCGSHSQFLFVARVPATSQVRAHLF